MYPQYLILCSKHAQQRWSRHGNSAKMLTTIPRREGRNFWTIAKGFPIFQLKNGCWKILGCFFWGTPLAHVANQKKMALGETMDDLMTAPCSPGHHKFVGKTSPLYIYMYIIIYIIIFLFYCILWYMYYRIILCPQKKGQLSSNSYMDSSQDRVYGMYGIAPMNSIFYRENSNMIKKNKNSELIMGYPPFRQIHLSN